MRSVLIFIKSDHTLMNKTILVNDVITKEMIIPDIEKAVISKICVEQLVQNGPKDAYWLVYILFFFVGLVRMMPWTFFLTANEYWMYKFRNVSSNSTAPEDRNVLQAEFSADLTIALRVSNIIFLIVTMLFGHKVRVKVRLLGALLGVLFCLLSLSACVAINTDSWQLTFFFVTLGIIGTTNAFTSVLDITVCSIVSSFPPKYLSANINGQGAAGICTALLQILSLTSGLSVLQSAAVYFALGIAIVLLTLILTFISMEKSGFYRYCIDKGNENQTNQTNQMIRWSEIKEIPKQIWTSVFIFLCYMIAFTPTISVAQLIVSEYDGASVWNNVYFVPVVTYLLAAVTETIGRDMAYRIPFTINDKLLCFMSVIRMFIFVPLIMLCNAQPRTHLPVIFPHDYQYIIIVIVFRITNGYMISISSLNIRKLIHPEKCKTALQVFSVINGICIAIFAFLSIVSVKLL